MIAIVLLAISVTSILVFIYNFKFYSTKIATDKAISIAQDVRDGLTSHMVNGTMDKREVFLNKIMVSQKLQDFHLLRAPSVVQQYGKGLYGESLANNLEKKVLQTSKIQSHLSETLDDVTMQISIPYIASSHSNPNCMQCHKAKEGEILGIISMGIPITNIRDEGIFMALKIFAIMTLLFIVAIYIANRYIRPYLKLFDDLEVGISKAYRGDFSYHIDTKLKDEAGKVAKRLNELSDVYKFKKTIEFDPNFETIIGRIVQLISKMQIESMILYHVDSKEGTRQVLFSSVDYDTKQISKSSDECRAFRTNEMVTSNDFEKICMGCKQKDDAKYLCFNYKIDENNSIVVHLQAFSQEMLQSYKEYVPIIQNYFAMAKPILESKLLLERLKETTLRDPMTGLYNRRFLTEVLDSNMHTRVKDGSSHAVYMLDIDFFKQVNDTYGHDIGDEVIKRLAHIMKNSIRDSDMAVRYGGEEFVILLLNTKKEKANEIAQTIRQEFASQIFTANGKTFEKTISIGIAMYPSQADTLWKAIKFSDEALYVAKESGRNRVINFEEKMHTTGEEY